MAVTNVYDTETNDALTIVEGAIVEGYHLSVKSEDGRAYTLAFFDRESRLYVTRKFDLKKTPSLEELYKGDIAYNAAFDFVNSSPTPLDAIKAVSTVVKSGYQSKGKKNKKEYIDNIVEWANEKERSNKKKRRKTNHTK